MKRKVTITLTDEAKERLLQWGSDNHISGGLSGAIEALAWKQKVKIDNLRGQEHLF